MNAVFESQFNMLASGWDEIIGFIAVMVIYGIIGAVKSLGNRSQKADSKQSDPDNVIELAKQYAQKKKRNAYTAQAIQKGKRRSDEYSEWDLRHQEAKREQLERPKERDPQKVIQKPDDELVEFVPLTFHEEKKEKPAQPVQAKDTISRINQFMQTITATGMQTETPQIQASEKRQIPAAKKKAAAKKQQKKIPSPKAKEEPVLVTQLLGSRSDLQNAIILKEILDKPVGLRSLYE